MSRSKKFTERELSLWCLTDPGHPQRVGIVSLDDSMRICRLAYDKAWMSEGFDLSPDLPITQRIHLPASGFKAPGAIEDAMPDRWGERMIRALYRPSRVTPLDELWYAGDRRFGALGLSADDDTYVPIEESPTLSVDSLIEAEEIINRIVDRTPIDERERLMVISAGSLGGAHPKMLIEDGGEWVAKFPRGSNVDALLIEHAAMRLAAKAGIDVAESKVMPGATDHILLVKRFDRDGGLRRHAASARTMLIGEGAESYASIASVVRRVAEPEAIKGQQVELFRRMVFNMMIDNTDDHTKNHAFLRGEDGFWGLSPAFDIPPQMNGLGQQAIPITNDPFKVSEFSREHALANHALFGMTREETELVWRQVATAVGSWKEFFSKMGVTGNDIGYLADFLDSEAMVALREGYDGGEGGTPPPPWSR